MVSNNTQTGNKTMTYEITIISEVDQVAYVSRDDVGFLERFDGPTFKADAIRYIKKTGGKNAGFKFETFKS